LAGLGRKEFNSGDILLASEVQGYLQDQAVMVFDDATARGSAIPSPSEGMLTYNKDTDQLELYDGSAFGPVGSDSGLIHIETVTLSGVASHSFNNVFSSSFRNYKIISNLKADTGFADTLNIRFRISASDDSSSNYQRQRFAIQGSSTFTSRLANQNIGICRFMNSNFNHIGETTIGEPFIATPTTLHFSQVSSSGNSITTEPGIEIGTTALNTNTSYDGFTLIPATSVNFSGTVSIYGLKE